MSEPLRLRDQVAGRFRIEVAFTGPGLDLGDQADPAARAAALAAVRTATGAEPRLMRQVHGSQVAQADQHVPDSLPECDGLITDRPDLALCARAADCVPVLLGDPETGFIAAVHAGRPGVESGVVPATVRAFRRAGAQPTVAWIGPHVCGACYEVPTDLRGRVAAVVPETFAQTSWGTPALDLSAGVKAQLGAVGVEDVRDVSVCTREDASWPSYRRDGQSAGRFAGLIWRAA